MPIYGMQYNYDFSLNKEVLISDMMVLLYFGVLLTYLTYCSLETLSTGTCVLAYVVIAGGTI